MTSREKTGLLSVADKGPARPLGERLFTIAWGAIQWPWLARSLWGGPLAAKHALLDRLGLRHDALPHLGSWKADTYFLTRIVDARVRRCVWIVAHVDDLLTNSHVSRSEARRAAMRVYASRCSYSSAAASSASVTSNARPGTRPLALSYLTPGLGWKSDYVALFDEKAGKIDVQGWITLTNNTGDFTNALSSLTVKTRPYWRWDQP